MADHILLNTCTTRHITDLQIYQLAQLVKIFGIYTRLKSGFETNLHWIFVPPMCKILFKKKKPAPPSCFYFFYFFDKVVF